MPGYSLRLRVARGEMTRYALSRPTETDGTVTTMDSWGTAHRTTRENYN
jgi:hypothetical protein